MGITSIELDRASFESLEIGKCELALEQPLRMAALGKVVVLAGPNGAGKSRLLRLIPALMGKHLDAAQRKELIAKVEELKQNIDTWQATLERLSGDPDPEAKAMLNETTVRMSQNKAEIDLRMARLSIANVVSTAGDRPPTVVPFVPTTSRLSSPEDVSDAQAKGHAKQMVKLGVDGTESAAPAYLRGVMRAAYRFASEETEEAQSAKAAEASLLSILAKLLDAKVVPTLNDDFNLVIGGVPLTARGLSPGQQVLFQFGCMLHAQGGSLENCIVLMDEPENHLHPQVMITLMDEIIAKLGPTGQIWIATHSVPLVAHLATADSSCLWLVENETVTSAKRGPEKVLDSLMGGEDGPSRLRDFLRLPSEYAALTFLAQCIEPPGVVGSDIKDPQTNQISSIVNGLRRGDRRIRVLDFGAGKARLLSTLAQAGSADSWLDYFAFDVDVEHMEERKSELKAVYGEEAANRNLNERDLQNRTLDPGSVDVVVLCNVLHEIEPSMWLEYFGQRGRITELLKDGGGLLIVEDYGIPIGERAHRYGFLLLDIGELRALFRIDEADVVEKRLVSATPENSRHTNRLVAHLVEKRCIGRADAQSRIDAIRTLRSRMKDDLAKMLNDVGSATTKAEVGRSYARTAQLLANAHIWLSEHGSTDP